MSEQAKMPEHGLRQMTVASAEVIALLTAAEQIADGLCDLARVIYDRDPRWKDQLAAANAAATHMSEALRGAEALSDEGYDEVDGHA